MLLLPSKKFRQKTSARGARYSRDFSYCTKPRFIYPSGTGRRVLPSTFPLRTFGRPREALPCATKPRASPKAWPVREPLHRRPSRIIAQPYHPHDARAPKRDARRVILQQRTRPTREGDTIVSFKELEASVGPFGKEKHGRACDEVDLCASWMHWHLRCSSE